MTRRIKVHSETNTTNIFSGRIVDELSGEEILTRNNIGRVAFRRFRVGRALVGTGIIETPIDAAEIDLSEAEYQLYDVLQDGLDYSTASQPFTFLWRVPDPREPFFDSPGTFYVVLRFYPRDEGEVEGLTFEVAVT